MSNSVRPHRQQHTRLPYPSPSPGACSNSCPLSQWCYPTISSSAAPFSFCLQSFLALGSFPVSWVFMSGGQKTRASASSISPSHEYSGLMSFRINFLDLLAVQRTLKSLLQHHSLKASILWPSAFFMVQLSHLYMTTRKTVALTIWSFVGKMMSLLFNVHIFSLFFGFPSHLGHHRALSTVSWWCGFLFFIVLLRSYWHTSQYKFKVYSIIDLYILWTDYHN